MLKNSKLPENYKAQGLKEADETLRVINMTDSQRRDHENFLKENVIESYCELKDLYEKYRNK